MTVTIKTGSDLKRVSRLSVDVADTVRSVRKVYTRQGGVVEEIPLWRQQAKIAGVDTSSSDNFGRSVAVSNDYAVVGSPNEDAGGSNAGAAYVFVRSGTSWSQQAKLLASDASSSDNFGYSIAISGDYVVVGAPGTDAAYVFVRSGTSWSQQAKLVGSDTASGDDFGFSVSISGASVVVGARLKNVSDLDEGAAYVFARSGTTWTEQAKLLADDPDSGDFFGESVSIDGESCVVGAPFDDGSPANPSNTDLGAAYVFVRSGTSWSQQAKLLASDASSNDRFGTSVTIDGDHVAVGSVFDDDAGPSSGSVYVFVRSGTSWTQQAKLLGDDTITGDEFGTSVAMDGNQLIVGAAVEGAGGSNAGAAYVFLRSQTSWQQQLKLLPDDIQSEDFFGGSVAVAGSYIAVGAIGEDTLGSNAGAAYIF